MAETVRIDVPDYVQPAQDIFVSISATAVSRILGYTVGSYTIISHLELDGNDERFIPAMGGTEQLGFTDKPMRVVQAFHMVTPSATYLLTTIVANDSKVISDRMGATRSLGVSEIGTRVAIFARSATAITADMVLARYCNTIIAAPI